MGISEKKMQIVINNYFKQECDVNTSIREAFEKGFRIGAKKGLSAQPYSDADIQKIQDLEQAQFDTVYQIGVEKGLQSAQKELSGGLYVDGYNDGYRDAMKDAQPKTHEKRTETHSCDCISRAAAIDAVNTWFELYVVNRTTANAVSIQDMLRALPSALPEQRWIPCSKRMPKEEKKTYWVCTDTEYQCECRWTNNRFGIGEGEWGWSIFDTPQYSKPIAWMPLPEPYAERREE